MSPPCFPYEKLKLLHSKVRDAGLRVRDLLRQVCQEHDVAIMKGHVSKDHMHLLVWIPPQVTISRLVQWLRQKRLQVAARISDAQEAVLGTAHLSAFQFRYKSDFIQHGLFFNRVREQWQASTHPFSGFRLNAILLVNDFCYCFT